MWVSYYVNVSESNLNELIIYPYITEIFLWAEILRYMWRNVRQPDTRKWPHTFLSQLSEDFANTFLFNDFLAA
jgi:uncharacterized protein YggT (Ycf19 family)